MQVPVLPTLNLDASSELIVLKLRWSHSTWERLWAEGIDRWIAPDGSGTVLGGIRSQACIDRPARSLRELYGPAEGDPSFMQVTDGVSLLRMGEGAESREMQAAPAFLADVYVPSEDGGQQEAQHPLAQLLQTALAGLIFPSPAGAADGTYRPVAMENPAGRLALVADFYRNEGIRTDRYWIDAEKGILLRMQHFGKGGSDQPSADIMLAAIVYEPEMPPGCFNMDPGVALRFDVMPASALPGGVDQAFLHPSPGVGVINVRLGPGTDYEVVGQLSEGDQVPVIGADGRGDWWQIVFNERPAWVYAQLVEVEGDASALRHFAVSMPLDAGLDIDAIDVQRAVEAVASFVGDEALHLTLIGISAMPNANLRQGAEFVDFEGGRYWVDVETYQLIEMQRSSLVSPVPGLSLSAQELRLIAQRFASEHSHAFQRTKDSLDFEAGTKDEQIYFFRWEDRGVGWIGLPPLLQVGVRVDGQIVVYLNTLDLVQ